MAISIHIEAPDAATALAEARRLAEGLERRATEPAPVPVDTPAPLTGEISVPKRRPGRPRKAPEEAIDIDAEGNPVGKQVDLEDAIASTENEPPPVEDVRKAIKATLKATDENTVWEMLKGFGVEGATAAVKAGKGWDVIRRCNELIAAAQKS